MKVILDTNVILDILQNRMPWAKDAVVILRAAAEKKITGCVTAKQITDIYFFSRKMFKGEENVDIRARQVISRLLGLFDLVDTLGADCQSAFGISNGDYEDAVLIASASRAGIDCIVTRNTDHFADSPVKIYPPSELADMLTPHGN